jgi:hypothetical protein
MKIVDCGSSCTGFTVLYLRTYISLFLLRKLENPVIRHRLLLLQKSRGCDDAIADLTTVVRICSQKLFNKPLH